MPVLKVNCSLKPKAVQFYNFAAMTVPNTVDFGINGKLYLTEAQMAKMPEFFGDIRFVWNQTYDWVESIYDARKAYCKKHLMKLYDKNHKKIQKNFTKLPKKLHFPSMSRFNKFLTHLKKKYKWLKYADSKALQNEVRNLRQTYTRMFKHLCSSPNYKSRKSHYQSFMTNSASVLGDKFFRSNHVGYIPKLGLVRFHLNEIIHNVKEVTVMQKPNGCFYISLTVESERQALPKTGKSVGIDLGRASLMTLSDGQKIDFKWFDKAVQKKRVEYQRKTARRRRRAKKVIRKNNHIIKEHHGLYTPQDAKLKTHLYEFHNYVKARRYAAKLEQKVKNQRYDYIQKWTTWLVRRYDFIAIEDLAVKKMMMSKKTIKSNEIACGDWRKIRDMLTYKCKWYGKALVAVNPAYTSQICYHCLTWCGKHDVNVREYHCMNKHCIYYKEKKLDRDLCSAKFILMLAYHEVSPFVYRQIPKYSHSSLYVLQWFINTTALSKQALILPFQANNPSLPAKAQNVPQLVNRPLRSLVSSGHATECRSQKSVAKGHPNRCPLLQ